MNGLLEQFCRDEAVDYKWIEKAKVLYGEEPKGKSVKTKKKTKDKSADMIQLHFDPEPAEIPAEGPDTTPGAQPTLRTEKTEAPAWMVKMPPRHKLKQKKLPKILKNDFQPAHNRLKIRPHVK